MIFKKIFIHLATKADIHINGNNDWDLQIHNPRTYKRAILGGSLGFGESYMDGWWDSKKLDVFFTRLLSVRLDKNGFDIIRKVLFFISQHIFNMQSIRRAFIVGEKHYDIGNDLYEAMLDSRLTYTCGYWENAKNLEEAQEQKLRLTCEKLHLQPGMHVLDIGCGWGSFAEFAAREYGVEVVGITVSKEQIALGQKKCAGLPVELRFLDYRNLPIEYGKTFDRVVSLGMFEHVGPKNYRTYFSTVHSILKDDGLFLLHTIGSNDGYTGADQWVNKYIFPNGVIPTLQQVVHKSQDVFIMEDLHNFGTDYDKTLMAWYENIESAWSRLTSYDERFKRMWRYYLLMSASAFRSRKLQLWQIVFSNGIPGGYRSVREIKDNISHK